MAEWNEELENYEAEGGIYFACPCKYYECYSSPAHGETVQICKFVSYDHKVISNWTTKIPL